MTTESSLKAIFRMSWYDSPRNTKSHTDQYYLKQHHTYWGFDDPLCRIQLIQVSTDTRAYYSALMNSHLSDVGPPPNPDRKEMREIIETLASNYDMLPGEYWFKPTDKLWSLADLFIRQYKNNICDGFGMRNVDKMYKYLKSKKETLIKLGMISKEGINNSGFPLWDDYNFEKSGKELRKEKKNKLLTKKGKN